MLTTLRILINCVCSVRVSYHFTEVFFVASLIGYVVFFSLLASCWMLRPSCLRL
ncbi:uncharacterized protein EI90DRAFT_3047829 [Cantharellus anzutake]|uniref:uncharacterized protein n=1 Tax=Cantharellus anzutake TaxID=1750568 RepID=UPI001907EA85|nr:uncharacterized protein EI90DRAFT_3061605 [Cantharellus anzutake]XP_038918519.1 uncharacterized protein EI90DRAFT_3047829 [Cantharellus anzutake]KAF8329704.1 hypothetical protein EI90DRAFT_3061605 [Cantharellus anzutake]KAF8335296.1 hypothetical protein EI90DRAFT_3047829 [Cantharellus anzutake]